MTYAFGSSDYGVPSTDPGELDCREVLEPWSQTMLTWANRPDVDLPFDTITEITSGTKRKYFLRHNTRAYSPRLRRKPAS